MSILEFLNRAVAFLGSILPYAFGIVLLLAVWGMLQQEEYDDDYITYTVSCSTVLSGREPYPDFIVNECLSIRSTR